MGGGEEQGISDKIYRGRADGRRRDTHGSVAAGHHDLDQVAHAGAGEFSIVQQRVELSAGRDLGELVLARDAVLLGAGEEVEQERVVVGLDVVVLGVDAVDLALDLVAVVVEDKDERRQALAEDRADLLERELERAVADCKARRRGWESVS